MRRAFITGLAALALTACSTSSAQSHPVSGTLEVSFETSSFHTDDGQGPYWLSSEGDTWRQITAPLQQPGRPAWGRVHLVVEGDLSAPGHYGHMGAYVRSLRVTRVIESRLISVYGQPSNN